MDVEQMDGQTVSGERQAGTSFLDSSTEGAVGRRAWAVALTIVFELILLLLLLTLNRAPGPQDSDFSDLVTFDVSEDIQKEEDPKDIADNSDDTSLKTTPSEFEARNEREPADISEPQVDPLSVPKTHSAPDVIPLSREQMASADISKIGPTKKQDSQSVYGPPDTGTPGDTQRVNGSGPNGEPLYAASWYREPGDSELAGYLSTATGPGWAIIACKTVPEFRVEDCVFESEYPRGSKIGNAILAAAWQFRVRPPRIGGQSQVGAWVRIRIDYSRTPSRERF